MAHKPVWKAISRKLRSVFANGVSATVAAQPPLGRGPSLRFGRCGLVAGSSVLAAAYVHLGTVALVATALVPENAFCIIFPWSLLFFLIIFGSHFTCSKFLNFKRGGCETEGPHSLKQELCPQVP